MKKIFLLIVILCAGTFSSYAQRPYKTALGIQGGGVIGIRAKHFIRESFSIEAIAGWSPKNSYSLQSYIELNQGSIIKNSKLYWGLGGFTGVYDNPSQYDTEKKDGFWLGVSGIAGIEYTFPTIPIACHLGGTIGYSFLPENDVVAWYVYGVSYVFKQKQK